MRRLRVRFSSEAAPICTMQLALKGTGRVKGEGLMASQLDLLSLTTLSGLRWYLNNRSWLNGCLSLLTIIVRGRNMYNWFEKLNVTKLTKPNHAGHLT